jgi:DNA-binding FrmR family transcriptional regulator
MVRYAVFALGFTAGWLARGRVDSPRAAVLTVLAAAMNALDRIKRAVAIEKDNLEDLVAEARARADALREEREATSSTRRSVDEAAA